MGTEYPHAHRDVVGVLRALVLAGAQYSGEYWRGHRAALVEVGLALGVELGDLDLKPLVEGEFRREGGDGKGS